MVVTANQAEQISQLAIVNITQQAAQKMLKDDLHRYRDVLAYSHKVTLTNPKIVDELWHRAHAQKVDTKDVIEDILWRAFFPNATQGQKTANMVRACPSCNSKNISELEDAEWECSNCHVQFDIPIWKQNRRPSKGDR